MQFLLAVDLRSAGLLKEEAECDPAVKIVPEMVIQIGFYFGPLSGD